MRDRLWIVVLVVAFCGACSWVDGECWLRSEDGAGSGAGGGPIIPGGGGFGDDPQPTPQDANNPPPPPECLQVPQGACFERCLKVYQENSDECAGIADESQRNVCQMAAYTAYKTCRDSCAMAESQWRKWCEEQTEKCEENCRSLPDAGERKKCWSDCNKKHGDCTKKCED